MKVMTENLKYIDIDPSAAGKLAQQLHYIFVEIASSFLQIGRRHNSK